MHRGKDGSSLRVSLGSFNSVPALANSSSTFLFLFQWWKKLIGYRGGLLTVIDLIIRPNDESSCDKEFPRTIKCRR